MHLSLTPTGWATGTRYLISWASLFPLLENRNNTFHTKLSLFFLNYGKNTHNIYHLNSFSVSGLAALNSQGCLWGLNEKMYVKPPAHKQHSEHSGNLFLFSRNFSHWTGPTALWSRARRPWSVWFEVQTLSHPLSQPPACPICGCCLSLNWVGSRSQACLVRKSRRSGAGPGCASREICFIPLLMALGWREQHFQGFSKQFPKLRGAITANLPCHRRSSLPSPVKLGHRRSLLGFCFLFCFFFGFVRATWAYGL